MTAVILLLLTPALGPALGAVEYFWHPQDMLLGVTKLLVTQFTPLAWIAGLTPLLNR